MAGVEKQGDARCGEAWSPTSVGRAIDDDNASPIAIHLVFLQNKQSPTPDSQTKIVEIQSFRFMSQSFQRLDDDDDDQIDTEIESEKRSKSIPTMPMGQW